MILTAAAALGISQSYAQTSRQGFDQSGYYAELDLGYAVARDAGVSGAPITGKIDDIGNSPVVGFALGYRFNENFRADISSRALTGFKVDGADGAGTNWSGDVDSWINMLNLYAELPLGAAAPYLTAGAGLARNHADTISGSNGVAVDGGAAKTSFAWQVGGGVGYALSPSWTVDVGYRYIDAGKFETGDINRAGTTGQKISGDLKAHTALLSLRYSFGAPQQMAAVTPRPAAAPPPPVAPAAVAPPAAAQPVRAPELPMTYMVFFDFDKSEISTASERVLQEAASTAQRAPVTRIVATGHADRAGPDTYNMSLSLRRATSVKSVLMRNGVPANLIVIMGKGEREPAVPTADGVREPRNRRVEIVVQ